MTRRLIGALATTAALVCAGACGGAGETGGSGVGAGGGSSSSGAGGAGGNSDFGGNMQGTGGSSQQDGCSKVDFLFIIDNSVSMSDQQAALIASFPGFISTIQTTLSATSDYHIMVADTDDWGRCTPSGCGSQSTCNNYACSGQFTQCDKTIGAGVINPAGKGASNQLCTIYGGNRYMIEGEPDLTGTFACVAQVGLAGNPAERPMDSLVAAMSPALNTTGGCNDGFLRDDAILVVTFISDDPHYEDAGVPQDWYDAVVAAKSGNADAVVVLGLTPNFNGCQDGKGPPKGAHWSEFVGLWGNHGLEASVCNTDYTPFFEQAIGVIDDTCDKFAPPS